MAGYRPARGNALDEMEAFYKRRQREIADLAHRATADARSKASQVSASLNASPEAKRGAGYVAGLAGNWAGGARGVLHAAEGAGRSIQFAGRLMNPLDVLISGPAESAVAQLGDGVLNGVVQGAGYVRQRAADPSLIAQDVSNAGARINRDFNPYSRPVAPTVREEMSRQFEVGKNQGELALDVGSMFLGGSAIKGAKFLNEAVRVAKPEEYLTQGFSKPQVRHLMRPYPKRGKGHHFFPQSSGLPKWFLDSRFNVLKPEGINRGDMYRLHGEVDTNFHGARMKRGMDAWTANQAEVQRGSLPERMRRGAPNSLKALTSGLGGVAGMLDWLAYAPAERGEVW